MHLLEEITPWHWTGFILFVLVCLALDLGVFSRRPHVVHFKEALAWTAVWVTLAMLFAGGVWWLDGEKSCLEFVTGYLVELSLSMDNVFVIALVFAYFRVPGEHRHRVLVWGVLGALVMRGIMIGAGSALILWLHWILYVFGAFLIFSGVKMLFARTTGVDPAKNPMVRLARQFYPVAPEFDGRHFITQWNGRNALTPLALVLVVIETTDLVFALDSIPAIFGVTTRPFIVFTSNVFAILGLRSLYFVLEGAIAGFRFLKHGLSLVLVFIGVKMLLDPHEHEPKWFQVDIPIVVALSVVGAILLGSIVLSRVFPAGPNPSDKKAVS